MITIVDYGVGNLGSILNMLKKVGAKAQTSCDPDVLRQAEKLILPGVGAFDPGMRKLNEVELVPLLNELVLEKKVPVIGLCLGMQLMTNGSEEGVEAGLGWIDAETVRFKFGPENAHLKIPHMGWNTLDIRRQHPLVAELGPESRFYFVHSYHIVCADEADVVATQIMATHWQRLSIRVISWGRNSIPKKAINMGCGCSRILRSV